MESKTYHTSRPVHALESPSENDSLLKKNSENNKIESVVELLRFTKGFSDKDQLKDFIVQAITEAISIPEVSDITALTDGQIDGLHAGDRIIKVTGTQKHAYTVSYKDDTEGGMCLTYCDCENVETVAYERHDGTWVYQSTDTTHISST